MRLTAALLLALPAWAHVVSMSTGEAKLNGSRLDYELRMPLYEVAHIRNPEPQLFANIHFRSGTSEARLVEHSCREDTGNLVCTGMYLFERDVDQFDVECTFAAITVPNHVHLLRAVHGDKSEQTAFDSSFTTTTVRFRPPTAMETAARDGAAGFWRATAGLAQILFLAALVLADAPAVNWVCWRRCSWRGQSIASIVHWSARMSLSPRFIEAAIALTIAYLAFEILILPGGGPALAGGGSSRASARRLLRHAAGRGR